MAPQLTGVHHLKFPVPDLAAGIAWFTAALGATRVGRFDHHDAHGRLYAVILELPGLPTPVELRQAPHTAAALRGYDPVTFAVADRSALEAWAAHLDRAGIEHSPSVSGFIGDVLELRSPDGLALRLYTDPPGGFTAAEMDPGRADTAHPSLSHPG